MRPHNLTLTMVGAGLLWFGWYGFNVGSIVTAAEGSDKAWTDIQLVAETGVTFMNTTLATMAAMLGWLLIERITHGKATSLGAASGVVAGLVAITPACGSVSLVGALAVGTVAGVLCALAVGLKYRLNLDDSLDVVGVHLVGGLVGTLMIGLVGTMSSPQGKDGFFPAGTNGLFYGGDLTLLGHQAGAALFTIVWTGVLTTIIAFAIKWTIGWRVDVDEEVEGIDFAEHGESAYDLVGGLWGTISVGLFASAATTAGVDGLFYGGGVDQLWRQVVGALAVLVFSFVVTWIIGTVIQKTMGFRITEEDEVAGIDSIEHAETAYDFASLGGSSGASLSGQAHAEARNTEGVRA
jgi:Amt family ammonium transporter